jgi:hypothetical protein
MSGRDCLTSNRRQPVDRECARIRAELRDPARLARALGLVALEDDEGSLWITCPVDRTIEPHDCRIFAHATDGACTDCRRCGWGADSINVIAVVERLDPRRDIAHVLRAARRVIATYRRLTVDVDAELDAEWSEAIAHDDAIEHRQERD